ncbi:MAG: PQQ-binding-like beta-propeller repeat protein [Bryobacterales bacterium]|nr:PQQ-binding-like beta-propeller repeat protein [Bryobacterales bacterium]
MILIVCAAVCSMQAQDWPQLRGPNRDGSYAGPGRVPVAQLWKKGIGQGFAAPSVAQGKLIVFHRDGNKELVEAWNPANGAKIWSYGYATAYRDDFGFDEGPRAAPTIDNGKVYTFGAEGQLHCVNLADGKRIWSEDTHRRFRVRKGYFGAASAPIVENGKVLVNIGGPEAGIVAFDAQTGKPAYQITSDEAGYSSPVAAMVGGLRRVLFLTRAGLVDVDAAEGKARHQMPWRSRSQASVNAAMPVAAGDTVFLSASYGTGAIALDVKGGSYTKLWSNDDSLSCHYATPVHVNGVLYGFHGRQEEGQEFRAVELRTGKVLWSTGGLRAGTVTLAGDTLLVLRENGELITAKADPKQFRPAGKYQLLDGVVRAYPAIADGRLILRNETHMTAYRLQ